VFSVKGTIKEELHLFSQVLQNYLSPMEVEQLARATEFVKRTSKYQGQDLVTLCVWLSHNLASTSLTQLCSELEAATGISMSAEGLNQRLNEHAITFLRQLFARLLKAELSSSSTIPSEYRDHFLRIRILDSTTFQVPDSLTEHYPGAGGCGHTAGVKIQLEYDLHSGQFLNLDVGAGKKNDKTFGTTCLSTLRPGDLCIRDLGYFSLEDLDQMDQRGTYYVSRLKLNNRIYQKNPEPEFFRDGTIKKQTEYLPLDLEEIMNEMQPGETVEIRDLALGGIKSYLLASFCIDLPRFKYRKDEKIKPIKRRKRE
jgi:hypothetical protein